jgi:hypothetical protein
MVFHVIGSLLFVLSFQGGTLSANVILVVMTMQGVVMKMMNPMKMTTIDHITMIGTIDMDRKLYKLKI